MKHQRTGFVLVTVLWILAILSVLTLGFAHRALLRQLAARYQVEYGQALMMARGATQLGMVELVNKQIKESAKLYDPGLTYLSQDWAQRTDLLGDAKYYVTGADLKGDAVWFEIEDCERYFDINSLAQEEYRDLLENIKALDRSVKRRLIKRLTEGVHDQEPRAVFQTPEELRYVDGVSDDDWFGKKNTPGLKNLITVYGGGRININTAGFDVLATIPGMDAGSVSILLGYRNGPDGKPATRDDRKFRDTVSLGQETGIKGDALNAISRFCMFSSACYKIRGTATRQGGKVCATCTAVVRMDRDGRTNVTPVLSWQEGSLGS